MARATPALGRTLGQHLTVCLLLLGVSRWTGVWIAATTASPFEAAFQGNCQDKNPCEQKCFDLNDGTFECACRQGQRLAADGYSCKVPSLNESLDSEEDAAQEQEDGEVPVALARHRHPHTRKAQSVGGQRSTTSTARPPAWLQSETLDGRLLYAPPQSLAQIRETGEEDEQSDQSSEEEEEEADWDDQSGDKEMLLDEQQQQQQQQQEQLAYEELDLETVVPFASRSGMRHTMQDEEYTVDSTPSSPTDLPSMQMSGITHTSSSTDSGSAGEKAHDHWAQQSEAQDKSDDDLFFGEEPSPVAVDKWSQAEQESESDVWRPFVPSPTSDQDGATMSKVDVLCQCQGSEPGAYNCVVDEGGSRCLCPLGRGGDHCEKECEVRFPKFSGHSHLRLPTIHNAFKDLQLVLEFRPQTDNGVLLYSGEQSDGLGDFISLALVNGYLEFRFDCGSGEGIARSNERILQNLWNRVTVFRHRWDAWMQLNNGAHAQGRSRGLFSRITFKEKLYVGGRINSSSANSISNDGFNGCIRYLEINGHVYDFRPAPKGNSEGGTDLGECSAEVCNEVDCKNGGKCIANSADSALCLCPLGFGGDYCEIVVDLIMPSFNGSSYLKYPGLGSSVLSFVELSVAFKPGEADGVLLYNGLRADGVGDFLALSLSSGFVELRVDLGSGTAVLRSPEPLSLHEWHTLHVSRTGRQVLLRVDSQPQVEQLTPGAFTQLSLPHNLYIGGVPSFDAVSNQLGTRTSFRGCIQKVLINDKPLKLFEAALVGVNVDNCNHPCVNRPCLNHGLCSPHKDYFTCHCLLGYADSRCQTEIGDNLTFPMFMGNSFLRYTQADILSRILGSKFDIRMRFKSRSPDGLLLWSGQREASKSSDFISLALRQGFVQLRFNLGSGEVLLQDNSSRVADGQWHTLQVWRTERNGWLKVDSGVAVGVVSPGPLIQLNTNTGLYLGGVPDVARLTLGHYNNGLIGCVANLSLSRDSQVQLVAAAQSGLNVEACV